MGLFNKDKTSTDLSQTNEVKKAAISDTQINSVSTDNLKDNNVNNQNVGNNSNNESTDFVNPFSQNNDTQMPINNEAPAPDFGANSSQNVSQQNSFVGSNQSAELGNNSPFNINDNNHNVNSASNLNQQPQKNNVQNNSFSSIENSLGGSKGLGLDKDQVQEMIDETVEKVIEEKWDTLVENVEKILKWKEKKEAEINMLKEDIVALGDGFSKLESKLINKISNYDKNILDVNSEIKALEKVFQKITPTLINNVNELSKITKDLKGLDSKDDKNK